MKMMETNSDMIPKRKSIEELDLTKCYRKPKDLLQWVKVKPELGK